MTVERTFSIVKPNAVANNDIGAIYARFERAGFKIIAAKMLRLTREQAEGFYAEHKGRPFFDGLVEFMTSGPIMVQVLNLKTPCSATVTSWAQPADNALAGTLRADYADSFTANAVHGSDSVESAQREIAYFFNESEICAR